MTIRFPRACEVAGVCALTVALSFASTLRPAPAQSAPEPSESAQLETIDAAPQLAKARGLFETRAFGATVDGLSRTTQIFVRSLDSDVFSIHSAGVDLSHFRIAAPPGATGYNWSTTEGGKLPNFLEINNAVSDHSAVGAQLDQGGVTSLMNTLITSSSDAAMRIAPSFLTCSITLVSNKILANHLGLQINGGNNISINGGEISTVGGGDAIELNSNATVAVASLNTSRVQDAALHVTAAHREGWITVNAGNERTAGAAVEVDPGTLGGYRIVGNGFADQVRDAGENPKRNVGSNAAR